MVNPFIKANSSGFVIDHGNGSYTGLVKALWKGHFPIKFLPAFFRGINLPI